MTSGATQPGVPHLGYRKGDESALTANPRSAITTVSNWFYFLNKIFSGFKSR